MLVLVIPLVYLAMSSLIQRPFVFPDEAGAITNARFLAGVGEMSPWWYLPGYGALAAPALAVTRDLSLVTWAFHLINAVLGFASVIGLVLIGRRRFPDVDQRALASASVVVMLYPAYQYFAALAIADNMLIMAGIWSVLAVERLRSEPGTAESFSLVVALGLVATVHSRALVIVLAAALALFGHRSFRLGTAVLAIGILASAIARQLVAGGGDTIHAIGARQSLPDLVSANASIRSLAVLPFTLLGQVINVSSATAGVAMLGLAIITAAALGRGDGSGVSIDRHVLLLVALTALLSALFTNQGQGDLAIYGRYLEVVLPIPLLVGVLFLLERRPPPWMTSSGPALLVMAACVLVAVRGYEAFETRIQILNVSGIGLAIRPFNRIDPILIALFGAVLMFMLAKFASRSKRLVLPFLLLLFFASALVPFERSIAYIDVVGSEGQLAGVVEEVRGVGTASCVGLDQAELRDPWAQENYQMLLLDVPFSYFDSASSDGPPCPDLVISARPDLGSSLAGWEAVAWERNRTHWLWVSPGLLAQIGPDRAIRPDPGTPLASLAATIEIEVTDTDPDDRLVEAVATITNTSSSTFVPASMLPEGSNPVRVGVEWRTPEAPGLRIHEPQRFELLEPFRPGTTQVIPVVLSRDLPGVSVGDGQWILRVELVQEAVRWADDSAAGTVPIEWTPS